MRRLVFVVPVLLGGLALLFVYSRLSDRSARAPRTPTAYEGESWRALPQGDWSTPGPERKTVPAVLQGRVFDPHGRPVRRAEVASILPRPYQLTFTDDNGGYQLEFERSGDRLIEARLTIDLAPQRIVVEIPPEGDPPPLDFHLKPTGKVFGEVMVEQAPVFDGGVDLFVVDLFGDKEFALDTDIDNGFFNFYWEPPKDVPLRLIVETLEGYMNEPREFTYTGEPVNLGRIQLVRYPTLKVRMRLPDGSYAEGIEAARLEHVELGHGGRLRFEEKIGWKSRIIVKEKSNVTARLVLGTQVGEKSYFVLRDVELALDQLRELEVIVRPGPFTVRKRLTDGQGAPIRARLLFRDGKAAESDDGGYFAVQVPHGGLQVGRITALFESGTGWVSLSDTPQEEVSFLLDADDAASDCRFALEGRVLVVADRDASVVLERTQGGSTDELPAGWSVEVSGNGQVCGVLSKRLQPGTYRWTRGVWTQTERFGQKTSFWEHPPIESGATLEVRPDALAVLDLR